MDLKDERAKEVVHDVPPCSCLLGIEDEYVLKGERTTGHYGRGLACIVQFGNDGELADLKLGRATRGTAFIVPDLLSRL